MKPLFVSELGMLDEWGRQVVTSAGYVVVELYRVPSMRALPIVLTEGGERAVPWEGSSFWARLRLAWALLTQR